MNINRIQAASNHLSIRRPVIVFDIDSTLCKSNSTTEQFECAKQHHPECFFTQYTHIKGNATDIYSHIFLPYLSVLFDYLLEKNAHIVFFSSGKQERNKSIITELLTSFWGNEQYREWVSKGQFAILSNESMRMGYPIGQEGVYVKDLRAVCREGESLLDVVLVEDDPSYTAHDQEPCIYIFNLCAWSLPSTYQQEKWQKVDHFPKNSTYYMIGLFKTYFEDKQEQPWPLRVWLDQILPQDTQHHASFFRTSPFAKRMMEIGLEEVQKQFPNATLYQWIYPKERGTIPATRLKRRMTNESQYRSFVRNLMIGNIPIAIRYFAAHFFQTIHQHPTREAEQPPHRYQQYTKDIIQSLRHTSYIKVQPLNQINDVCIIPTAIFNDDYRHIALCLSFNHLHDQENLEQTAKKSLQHIQKNLNIDQALDHQTAAIINVSIAFSANDLLAAYHDHTCTQKVYLTEVYHHLDFI